MKLRFGRTRPILASGMDELDEAWSRMLLEAGEKAAFEGRDDVAAYLRLKAANDVIRATAVKWLLDLFVEIAFRSGHPRLEIERLEGQTFAHGASTMAGTLLTIRLGVRCLSVEAGWARTPQHGIMRGAALARANILHFGRKRDDQALVLARGVELPAWSGDEGGSVFTTQHAEHHVGRLLQD